MSKWIKKGICIVLCFLLSPILDIKSDADNHVAVVVDCPVLFGESRSDIESLIGKPNKISEPKDDAICVSYDYELEGAYASMSITFEYDIMTSIYFAFTDSTNYNSGDQTVCDYINDNVSDKYAFCGENEETSDDLGLFTYVTWGYDIRDIGYSKAREWCGEDFYDTRVFSTQYKNNPEGDFVYAFFPIKNISRVIDISEKEDYD